MNSLPTGGLIRDLLPERLQAEGFDCLTRNASGRELSGLLGTTLSRVIQDFLQQPSAENAAEAIDLLHAAAEHHGISPGQIEKAQEKLLQEEGKYGDTVLEAIQRRQGA